MDDKKRLEEIKEWMEFRHGSHADNVRWLIERNEFLEKANRTNMTIAEYLKQERDSYKQFLEELDNEFESMLHYGFEGKDHLYRARKNINKVLGIGG